MPQGPGSVGGRRRLVRGLAATAPLLLAVQLLASASLSAQGISTAGLRGRVLSDGVPVEGAGVTLTHVPTGSTASALTDAGGRYVIPNQRPGGPYGLTVERIGFAGFERAGLQLLLGQFVDYDVELVSEAVEVEELRVEVEQDLDFNPGRIGLSTLVTSRELEELPTITRNFLDFAALSPLARVSDEGISVVGTNFRFNNLRVDGALNQDVFGLSTNNIAGGRAGGRVIPLDAIEQFQVLVSPFDVRQSGFTGGVLNAVTRSGTNELEGSVFGFLRDEALVGEIVVDDVSSRPDELSTTHAGFTLGGPIARDRAHFFVAGEWERVRQPPDGFHVGESDPFRLALISDSVARLQSVLAGYGVDAGAAGPFTLENTIANLFARFDWAIGDRHDAMLRYSFSAADDDPDPNRLPGDAYEFSSAGSQIRSRNHSAVFRLLSSLGGRLSNELTANVQVLSDEETAFAGFPRVEVTLEGEFEDEFLTRQVRAGANLFAQDNALEQRVFQIANNLTYALGSHQLLVGVSGTRFDFDRRFVPSAIGNYRFASLADLEANRPDRYEITVPLTEDGANPRFGVWELAAYLQDEWAVDDALTLRAGLRVDVPILPGAPDPNSALLDSFLGIDTSRLPGANPSLSPRLGLNWRPTGGTQVRAGLGVFTGRPAFSWLANAYQNTGTSAVTIVCTGEETPAFAPGGPPPLQCLDGPGTGLEPPIINVFDRDFRFPQDLRTMVAVDQRLPGGFVLSASWIYNQAVKQIFIEDRNLVQHTSGGLPADGYTDGFGFRVRDVFGVPSPEAAQTQMPSDEIFHRGRVDGRFAQVLNVTNRSDNFSYAATVELRKNFGERFGVRGGYSFTRSADLQSLSSLDVTSNYAVTPVDRNPNDPVRQPSLFDRPAKLVANAFVRVLPQFGGTEVSLLYVGQSGVPYTYVYLGDVNGDGIPGPRATDLANDPVWIPELPSQFPGSIVNAGLFQGIINLEDCLQEQVLKVMTRNSCRTPWSNQLDFRISQNVRASAFSAEITFDLLNLLNLFDSAEGLVWTSNPAVQLFRVQRHSGGGFDTGPNPVRARWVGPVQRSRETGGVVADVPLAPAIPTSQWRAQLGVRLRFGGNR